MPLSSNEIRRQVEALGPWFHNIDLGGVATAPDHFLGNYPYVKWQKFADAIPADLTGRTVLDIGCNAGFYSIEMKRRNAARVLAIDFDEAYLHQQAAAHLEALVLHKTYAARGDNAALKAVAEKAQPVVQHHIDELRRIGGEAMKDLLPGGEPAK